MAVILAQSSTHRTTGDSRIWYLSDIPALDSETATGTGLPTIATLTQVGQLSSSISETEWHRAQGVQSTTQSDVSITYTNDAAGSSGGPLDDWRDYTFNEHDSILYIDGDIVWRGTHRGEPSFSNSLQSRTVTSVLTRPRGPQIALRKWAGIPTGIQRLTGSGSLATAPSNAAYDTSNFTIVGHFIGGFTQGRLLVRGGQFFVQVLSGTSIQFRSDNSSGVSDYIKTIVLDAATHPFFSFAWSISNSRSIVAINGQIALDDAISTRIVATGSNVGIGGSVTSSGFAFVSRAVSKEELISLDYSSLALDSAAQSIWRCDDGTGNTVTDYGPLANHASIAGTENTDFRWPAADTGDPSIAGQLIPELYGHQRLTPALQIDQSRSRHAIARNPTDIATATIREGGVSITPTAITSTGIIDLSGSASKPVTADTSNVAYFPVAVIDAFLSDQWPTIDAEDVSKNEAFGDNLFRGQGGIYITDNKSVSDVLDETLKGLGGWWDTYTDGRLATGVLTQPAPAAPLERYIQAGGQTFNSVSHTQGSVTGWVLCRSHTTRSWKFSSGGRVKITSGVSDSGGQQTLNFEISNASFTTILAGPIVPRNSWVFFGASLSSTSGPTALTFYVRAVGDSAAQIVTANQPGIGVGGAVNFDGGRLCSWQDVAYYDTLLTTANFDDLFDQTLTPQDLSATFHAPLSSATLHASGTHWVTPTVVLGGDLDLDLNGTDGNEPDPAPVLQPEDLFDLSLLPDATLRVEHLTSIDNVEVKYDRGPGVLSNTDLGALVSSADRPSLQTEWFKVSVRNSLEGGETSKSHDLESMVSVRAAALVIGKMVADTNKGSLYLVEVTGLPRSAASLTPHAEILLIDREGQQWAIRVVRRLTNNPLNPDTSGAVLGLGRKL